MIFILDTHRLNVLKGSVHQNHETKAQSVVFLGVLLYFSDLKKPQSKFLPLPLNLRDGRCLSKNSLNAICMIKYY